MERRTRLRSFLAAVRRRWFTQEALGAASRASAAAALAGLTAIGLYYLFGPEGGGLVLLAASAIVVAVTFALLAVARMRKRPGDRQVARFIEERTAAMPGGVAFEDALVTAVDSPAVDDPAFGALLVSTALDRLRGLAPADIVPPRALRRGAIEAGAGLFALSVVLAFGMAPLGRAAETARLLFFPRSIQVEVLPGDVRLVAGEPVRIRAVVRAGERILTRLEPSLTVTAGAGRRTVPMTPDGNGFVVPFESVDRTFRYVVTAGAASSREHTVTALFPPRVERIDLSYRYPSFTGLPPREEEDGGDIYAPAGTRVRVRVHADKPLAEAQLAFPAGAVAKLEPGSDGVVEVELTLARDDSYRVELSDTDGLHAGGDVEYFIRLMDDRPPEVRILRPAGDQRITPLEEVAIEARADDDHGIASLELVYAVAGGPSRTVPFATITAAGSARVGAHVLAAEELDVEPGDVITYYARARDVGRGKRPTVARSDMYFLEVRPFGEEFVAAQSAGGGGAAGARIESLIAAQKEIISATWNIERRSAAGRSSKDVAAVALAQAELKARAEQIASRRGRGGLDFPQQIVPRRARQSGPRGSAGVSTAIAAMGRAVSELQGERTRDALAHEMAALQALLQVQAEIRRREVAMQQNSGGSGAGRSGEDLSALFDKELQRQQSTRYENRSSIQERADRRDEESALDRIRDLARRQEELSRRQRDLAEATLEAEARKRQLERLTREQEDLQQQVEALARRTESDGRAGRGQSARQKPDGQKPDGQKQDGASGRGSADAGRRNPFQDASEQMRGAAGALGRDDVKGASEQAARAAGQLRRIEEIMRGESPEARRRAASDLQLDAQQIAGEQRRIAAEAARLDKADPAASADGRRRLAGEKDQLADRVDGLERSARSLAGQGRPGREDGDRASSQADAVARELEGQQIGARMRETAKAMRDGESANTAPAEEAIAQALERVAGQLAGGAAEAGDTASRLEETRRIRDRLDSLERRIADAEAKAGHSAASSSGGERGNQGRTTQTDVDELRQEYGRELERAREALGRLQASAPRSGEGGASPERHEWSVADPGTEGRKQDFSDWETLRKDIDLALGRVEAAASAKLAREAVQDRLSAGGSERVPDAYERLIARYYEALARGKQ